VAGCSETAAEPNPEQGPPKELRAHEVPNKLDDPVFFEAMVRDSFAGTDLDIDCVLDALNESGSTNGGEYLANMEKAEYVEWFFGHVELVC